MIDRIPFTVMERWILNKYGEDWPQKVAHICGVHHTTPYRWYNEGFPINRAKEIGYESGRRFYDDFFIKRGDDGITHIVAMTVIPFIARVVRITESGDALPQEGYIFDDIFCHPSVAGIGLTHIQHLSSQRGRPLSSIKGHYITALGFAARAMDFEGDMA